MRVLCALVVLIALVCCGSASAATSAAAAGLAGGGDHSCVLRSSGHVDCWGWNQYAQLGDGTNANSGAPVEVQGVSDATQLAAGGDDSCVVLPSGHIDCWGWNGFGQLGDGTEEEGPDEEGVSTPVEVLGISDATQVAVGDHSCAVLSTGHIDCWGENYYGALGDGRNARSNTPVEVRGISNAVEVAVGGETSCALLSDGHVDCWGRNEYGQLGDGGTANSLVAVEVRSIADATEVATGGAYSCALLSGGRVDCWGADYYGQLGDGAEVSSSTPVEVLGISDATQVALGEGVREHACALLGSGHVDCWGRNESGQLGDGTTASSSTPVEVEGVANATEVASSWHDSCALLSSGYVDCWGGNEFGQLGGGTLGDSSVPVEVRGISTATDVTAAYFGSCATLSTGHVECWGEGETGELGDGSDESRDIPVEVLGISDATQVAGGGEHACAVLSSGDVDCWGANKSGQLGDGSVTSSNIPVEVHGISDAIEVAAGESHSCALLTTGHVDCWGGNGWGELGNDAEADSSIPVEVQGISNATQVAAGEYYSCALLSNGHVECWGDDLVGELGDGSEESSSTPVEVEGVSNATEVTAGGRHSCAVLSTGDIDCWGYDRFGVLGNGSGKNSDIPVEVQHVSDATGVTAGYGHSCALLSTGHVECWGENWFGELGNGSEENSDIPVQVQAVSDAADAVAGGYHSCALLSTGHIECWGIDYEGELGDGLAFSEVPEEVLGLDPEELSGAGPSSPSAETGGRSSVTQSSATLDGSVNPNGNAVASWCRFEYGLSEAYGSSAPCPATLAGGSSPEDVSSSLTGLSAGTSYHYRLVAVNAAGGISYGADRTFGTAAVTEYPLSVAQAGTGSGTVECEVEGSGTIAACAAEYREGTKVVLTAAAQSRSTFAGWSGEGCSGTGACKVTMSVARSVTATFDAVLPTEYPLIVTMAGTGVGAVTCDTGRAPGPCAAMYSEGAKVTLTATASVGSTFAGWSGACAGAGSCEVEMSAARSVTATFDTTTVTKYEEESTLTGSVLLDGAKITTQRNRRAAIELTCVGTGTCSGKLTLTAKRLTGKIEKKRSKAQSIGTGAFAIPAGKTATVTLALTAAGRALLKVDHGKLKATLTILKLSPSPTSTQHESVHLVSKRATKLKEKQKSKRGIRAAAVASRRARVHLPRHARHDRDRRARRRDRPSRRSDRRPSAQTALAALVIARCRRSA